VFCIPVSALNTTPHPASLPNASLVDRDAGDVASV
jgi:hypothetical protein